MAQQGKVKFFLVDRGYGYVTADNGMEIFFHHSGVVKSAGHPLQKGDRVSFVETAGDRGPKAVDVRKIA